MQTLIVGMPHEVQSGSHLIFTHDAIYARLLAHLSLTQASYASHMYHHHRRHHPFMQTGWCSTTRNALIRTASSHWHPSCQVRHRHDGDHGRGGYNRETQAAFKHRQYYYGLCVRRSIPYNIFIVHPMMQRLVSCFPPRITSRSPSSCDLSLRPISPFHSSLFSSCTSVDAGRFEVSSLPSRSWIHLRAGPCHLRLGIQGQGTQGQTRRRYHLGACIHHHGHQHIHCWC